MAYIVGTGLLILVLVGVPLQYAAGKPEVVQIVGPIHGMLYIIYHAWLAGSGSAFCRWPPWLVPASFHSWLLSSSTRSPKWSARVFPLRVQAARHNSPAPLSDLCQGAHHPRALNQYHESHEPLPCDNVFDRVFVAARRGYRGCIPVG
ncbi:MAG: DUF3817 domain-containing protein [Actinobacteria bacterium]|nr:DUF3817 domain-containing protein [Actinomycetota bacterium]